MPKKGNDKEYSNYCTIALISYTSKLMLKILHAKFQQYVNCELPDVQVGFRKGRRTRDQISNILQIIRKARESKQTNKTKLLLLNFYAKPFDCVDENKLWKILQEMGTPHHLSCLLCGGQEAIGRARHGTTDWFQIGKGVRQGCTFSLCLFNLYAEYTS